MLVYTVKFIPLIKFALFIVFEMCYSNILVIPPSVVGVEFSFSVQVHAK